MGVYGLMKNGELTLCKAKPENRGVGNCTHYEHFEITREEAKELNREHAKNLEKRLKGENKETFLNGMRKKTMARVDNIPEIMKNAIRSHEGGRALTREEFNGATIKLASNLPDFTSKTMSSFYQKLEERTSDPEVIKNFKNNTENIYSFLISGG